MPKNVCVRVRQSGCVSGAQRMGLARTIKYHYILLIAHDTFHLF